MFRVGDKVVFTAKSNSDLFTIMNEGWETYSSEEDYHKEINTDAELNEYIKEENKLVNFEARKYSYSIILKASEGYTFTKDSIVTLNGTRIYGSAYYGTFYAGRTLDLTDRPAEEKNKDAINNAIFEVILAYETIGTEGITDELYNELVQADNNGSDVSIELTKTALTNNDAKKELDSAAAALLKNAKVASYLDLSIPVTIDGDVKGYITELVNPVSLTIEIPSDLSKVANNYIRTYNVIRIHEGKATALNAFDNGNGTITFETDQFSSYALTYTDVINPATGDNITIYALISLISIIALAASVVVLKKNN